MKVKYVAICKSVKKTVWLCKFYFDLEVIPNGEKIITLCRINSGAIVNSKELRDHKAYHLIWEIVQRRDVQVCEIPIAENLADPFTKNLLVKDHW